MHQPFYNFPLTIQQQQQSQTAQWAYQPSFYNGYSTHVPITVNQQFVPVVQSYFSPVIDQVDRRIPQSSPVSSSTYPSSSMKSYNLFRNAFSRSNHHIENNSHDDFLYQEQQLNRNLAKYDFGRLPVKGDGNCLFYALAEGIMYEMKNEPDEFGLEMRRLFRLPGRFYLVDFADRLRQMCVDQWRLHEDYYSGFVDRKKVDFRREVRKFSKNGVSDSTLGDIVPLTVSNTLDINLTIFTSLSDLSIIKVKPEHNENVSSSKRKTIYLAYNQYGAGHYDAAYPRS